MPRVPLAVLHGRSDHQPTRPFFGGQEDFGEAVRSVGSTSCDLGPRLPATLVV